jgi:hypothetical protein
MRWKRGPLCPRLCASRAQVVCIPSRRGITTTLAGGKEVFCTIYVVKPTSLLSAFALYLTRMSRECSVRLELTHA